MKLKIEEIFKYIKEYQSAPQWILDARDSNKTYEALVLGKDYLDELQRIEKRETQEQLVVRKKYSRNIIDIFERVFRNVDNIYSANGGVIDIDVKDKKKFFEMRSNVRNGIGLTKWLDTNWSRILYNTDPNGLLMYEIKDSKPLLTYKSIHSLQCYEPNGQFVEWLLFAPIVKKDYTEWKFVDEKFYYKIHQTGEDLILVEQKVNQFKRVPACIISDLEQFGTLERQPKMHYIVSLCKEYLKDTSIKTIFKQLHGMPIFWRYAVACNTCKGEGKVNGVNCTSCDGQGYYVRKDIADAVILPVPSSDNAIKLAPDMAGYVVPPIEIWTQYNLELEFLEAIIYDTLWGSTTNKDTTKTVIETISNAQPVINSLNKFADSAQLIDWVLSEILVPIAYPLNNAKKNIVTVAYGRNFILEAISDLLKRYHDDKIAGDNSAILDRDLHEWIHAKYKHNPIMLRQELIRLDIEPYIHFTLDQVKDIFGMEYAQKKILFAEFWKTSDKNKEGKVLEKEFDKYLKENQKVEPKVEPTVIN